jgi:hypothetical protein
MFITSSVEDSGVYCARFLAPYSLSVGCAELIFGYLFTVRKRESVLTQLYWLKVYPIVMGVTSLMYCLTFVLTWRLALLGPVVAVVALYFVWRKTLYSVQPDTSAPNQELPLKGKVEK